MQPAAVLQYPEFIAAAVITMVLVGQRAKAAVAVPSSESGRLTVDSRVPAGLSKPAAHLALTVSPKYAAWLARQQEWSGWRSNSALGELITLKLGLALAALLSAFAIPVIASIAIALIAFFAPDLVISTRARRRQDQIRQSLPQALDLMVLCVDAGLGLDATLHRIAAEKTAIDNSLNEEIALLGRDILLGMERERAYAEMYRRTGVEELKMLGSALNQSSKMGLSIARILRAQSEFLRTRQQQKAEEKAAKLPVWMAFPLWFCIMPALLIALVAPSIIRFLQNVNHAMPAGLL